MLFQQTTLDRIIDLQGVIRDHPVGTIYTEREARKFLSHFDSLQIGLLNMIGHTQSDDEGISKIVLSAGEKAKIKEFIEVFEREIVPCLNRFQHEENPKFPMRENEIQMLKTSMERMSEFQIIVSGS
ncbi:MAG TPA: hypothetical protein VJH63_00500 [Candidatus Paceibacterota bacterium]